MGLILARNVGDAVRIGDSVLVRVLRIAEGRVELAIEAPAHVEICRDEASANEQAAPAA